MSSSDSICGVRNAAEEEQSFLIIWNVCHLLMSFLKYNSVNCVWMCVCVRVHVCGVMCSKSVCFPARAVNLLVWADVHAISYLLCVYVLLCLRTRIYNHVSVNVCV